MRLLISCSILFCIVGSLAAQPLDRITIQPGSIGDEGKVWSWAGGPVVIELMAVSATATGGSLKDTTDKLFLGEMTVSIKDVDQGTEFTHNTYAFRKVGGKVEGTDTVMLSGGSGKYQLSFTFDRKRLVATPGTYFPRLLEGYVQVSSAGTGDTPQEKPKTPRRFKID